MKLLITAPMLMECQEKLGIFFNKITYLPWTLKEDGCGYTSEEILELLNKYQPDVLISELDDVNEEVIASYGKLKIICDCRANPANIDVTACSAKKIPVICTPARNAQAVAELLVGLLIGFYRNIYQAMQWTLDGKWVEGKLPYSIFMGNELYGKKVGFVGFGAVGQKTASILEAFGCEIAFYDPYVDFVKDTYHKEELETIFRQSDVVSVHLPVLESTRGMIDSRLIGMMKETAVFVNTARSAVIVTEALYDALESHKIRGAVLDVLDHEPPKEEDLRLGRLPNVLLTPHIAGASEEVFEHQSHIVADRLYRFLEENEETVVYNRQIFEK